MMIAILRPFQSAKYPALGQAKNAPNRSKDVTRPSWLELLMRGPMVLLKSGDGRMAAMLQGQGARVSDALRSGTAHSHSEILQGSALSRRNEVKKAEAYISE